MRIGIQASYSGGFQQTAAEIRDLESAGLDLAAVAEVYTFDAVSQLGYLAAVTERVELLSAIFPIYSRTPALTAMTAAGPGTPPGPVPSRTCAAEARALCERSCEPCRRASSATTMAPTLCRLPA